MPHRTLTKEQRAEALRNWWARYPFRGNAVERLAAMRKAEEEFGPLTEKERTAALYRLPLDGDLCLLEPEADMGQDALKLCGQLLDDSHYDADYLLDRTGILTAPSVHFEKDGYTFEAMPGYGATICVLLKNVLPKRLIDAVRPIVRKAASQRSVAGGNRGVAAGTGMVERKNQNGQKSKIRGAQTLEELSDENFANLRSAKDGTFGYLGRGVRGGQKYPCRLTRYDGVLPSELRLMSELAEAVAESFKNSMMQNRWEAQFAKANQTAPTWLIRTNKGITPFTTITCNLSFRTAAHIDAGDLKEGFGVMCCFGDFEGCDLVFPRYRAAVRYREGDVLLANVHEVHGNTPLRNVDGSVPQGGREPERLVCVFYFQEKMEQCERTVEKELELINRYERGQSKKKAKKKAKAAKA